MEVDGYYSPQDWFLCSQCKRAFHSKIQLFQHKRQHYIESINLQHENSKRKRVEEWVRQVQLQLEQNNFAYDGEKENSETTQPSSEENATDEPKSKEEDNPIDIVVQKEPETSTSSTPVVAKNPKASKRKKEKATVKADSNHVTRRSPLTKKKLKISPTKRKTHKVLNTRRKKTRSSSAGNCRDVKPQLAKSPLKHVKIDPEERVVFKKHIKVMVKLESYKYCSICRGTFLDSETYTSHLPCNHPVSDEMEIAKENPMIDTGRKKIASKRVSRNAVKVVVNRRNTRRRNRNS